MNGKIVELRNSVLLINLHSIICHKIEKLQIYKMYLYSANQQGIFLEGYRDCR